MSNASSVKGYWAQVWEQLFPSANRVMATVAFFRTFGQTIRGSAAVGALLGAGVTVSDLATIDWTVLGFGASAIVLTALIAGADSGFNMLRNGLPESYTKAVVKSITDTRISTIDDRLKDAVTSAAAAIKKEDQ